MTAEKIHIRPSSVNTHQTHAVERQRKKIILCFDGTGNKFKGNEGDTNILKIFHMLDRSGPEQFYYYQPGIGTYITNGTLSRVHVYSRIKSWCQKAMDAAVGTSFDQHVIGGYKFLMRHYEQGDDIYFFGFSRGAYTARFLAEMLDHVGLVSSGNEEMVLFAWKTFSNWQQRQDGEGWGKKKEEMYNYMKAFRETFARPVRRVRFIGLFDTVNAVPRFEDAWLKRSKGFPYTARSTACVIRHAVGIDERRAKFRQDLVEKIDREVARRRSFKTEKFFKEAMRGIGHRSPSNGHLAPSDGEKGDNHPYESGRAGRSGCATQHQRFSGSHERLSIHNPVPGLGDRGSITSLGIHNEDDGDRNGEQDIEEVWFPGAHADIGGGWDMADGEFPLSQGPLIWMVREARKAGVVFDKERMKTHNCWLDEFDLEESDFNLEGTGGTIPKIEVSTSSPTGSTPQIPIFGNPTAATNDNGTAINGTASSNISPTATPKRKKGPVQDTRQFIIDACTKGKIHDCLRYPSGGLTFTGTLGWKVMEYLPFRRMDLQPDGSWKPIIWPLPCGEVRDIPDDVKIHNSVIKRMEADPKYRPGNLLVGGGGRGVRVAPKHLGMGEWVVLREEGSLVGEVLVKKSAWEKGKTHHQRERVDSGKVIGEQV
ncbi:hypothetical protein DFP73DRAFT_472225 [Morchella snyderi]|nr:hypothetical protein DFP73DRAFT_472225 [Morchella snyderi]